MADGYTMAELVRVATRLEATIERLPEEIARQHVTRTEYVADMGEVRHRLTALETGRSWWRDIGRGLLMLTLGAVVAIVVPRVLGAIL